MHVHTDHKNLTYANLTSQRVIHWRLYIEEFHPIFHHISGVSNTLADALSRLPPDRRQSDDPSTESLATEEITNPATVFCISNIQSVEQPQQQLDIYRSNNDITHEAEPNDGPTASFMNLPLVNHEHPFLLDYSYIKDEQDQDADLQQSFEPNNKLINIQMSADTELICYLSAPEAEPKIYIPDSMLEPLVRWYHEVLNHPGMNRLFDSINAHMYNRKLRTTCNSVVSTCDTCQRYKLPGRGYGETPPRTALVAPWHEVAVDLVGPWKIKVPGYDDPVTFNALTVIDTVTNLTELIHLPRKTSRHVAIAFQNALLTRYPRPIHVIYDQGGRHAGARAERAGERQAVVRLHRL